MTGLEKHGWFTGYPDGTFPGQRALTRYEFAVALQRVLTEAQHSLDYGSTYPCVTDVDVVLRLTHTFGDVLALLGADVEQIRRNLAVLRDRSEASNATAPPYRSGKAKKGKPSKYILQSDWAYEAFTYFIKRHVLPSNAIGAFYAKRTLTRKDFAEAMRRLVSDVLTGFETEFATGKVPSFGDIETLLHVVQDFMPELTALGEDPEVIVPKLTTLREILRQP